PGYPLAFGRFGSGAQAGPLVFGLPGNPVSATVCFDLFVRPSLLKMMGRTNCFRSVVRVRLAETLRKKPGRLHFVRVELEKTGDGWEARSTGNQSSGVLSSLARASGLLVFPEEAEELAAGAAAVVQLVADDIYSESKLGF
ncbi:MAG: molybdopterin molybdenumtransferase MoeA, partial [Myxococcota bacterium]